MRIHHLNCGTVCPLAAHRISPLRGMFASDHAVCHCLLIEAPHGLILVDTGLGTEAVRNPARWLGGGWSLMSAPRLDPAETAQAQIARLGFRSEDVREILVTHLDLDHAGGLADFPGAQVHVFEAELEAAWSPSRLSERRRYRPVQWEHQPRWVTHRPTRGTWFGFEGVHAVSEALSDVLMVPLVGHSRGHTGVAVRTAEGWLVHAGDAYFSHGEIHEPRATSPSALELMQVLLESDRHARLQNQDRLRALAKEPGMQVFCSHDPVELEALRARSPVQMA